jgi:hypothetical protein
VKPITGKCPFPPCRAAVTAVDGIETSRIIKRHDLDVPAEYRAGLPLCPASWQRVDDRLRLLPDSKRVIDEMHELYMQNVAVIATNRVVRRLRLVKPPAESQNVGHGTRAEDGPFPGRPADAPEPTTYTKRPPNTAGRPLGKAAGDMDAGTLRAMMATAEQKAQEASAMLQATKELIGTAHGLYSIALAGGGREEIPAPLMALTERLSGEIHVIAGVIEAGRGYQAPL